MAEVFNRFADDYRKQRLLSFEQQKLIRDIRQCRSYELGGHVTACTACGHIKCITTVAATGVVLSAKE